MLSRQISAPDAPYTIRVEDCYVEVSSGMAPSVAPLVMEYGEQLDGWIATLERCGTTDVMCSMVADLKAARDLYNESRFEHEEAKLSA